MEAIYFGTGTGGLDHGGAGKGPWIMADMENALWGADKVDSEEEPIEHAFVTAMVKGDTGAAPGHWAIKGADAQAGTFKTYWDGPRAPGYAPMKKQGAVSGFKRHQLAQIYTISDLRVCQIFSGCRLNPTTRSFWESAAATTTRQWEVFMRCV